MLTFFAYNNFEKKIFFTNSYFIGKSIFWSEGIYVQKLMGPTKIDTNPS